MSLPHAPQRFRQSAADACRLSLSLTVPRSLGVAVQPKDISGLDTYIDRLWCQWAYRQFQALLAADRYPFVQIGGPIQPHTHPRRAQTLQHIQGTRALSGVFKA